MIVGELVGSDVNLMQLLFSHAQPDVLRQVFFLPMVVQSARRRRILPHGASSSLNAAAAALQPQSISVEHGVPELEQYPSPSIVG